MRLLLLPGMDGTGILFREFVRHLPDGIDAKVVSYPEDRYLTYEQLAEQVRGALPMDAPYAIVAESYSGPVGALLAAHPAGNLQAVVFVASFVSFPRGRVGRWIAKVVPAALFRPQAPAWILRWLLMDSAGPLELISDIRSAVARVNPEVLAQRLRDALTADYSQALGDSTVRMVCLFPDSDRLLGTRGRRGFVAANPGIEIVKIAGPHLVLQCSPDESIAVLRKLGLLGGPLPAP